MSREEVERLVNATKRARAFDGCDQLVPQLLVAFVGRQIQSVEAVQRKERQSRSQLERREEHRTDHVCDRGRL